MRNYMTRYDETQRVQLSDPEFWVEVKVNLPGGQKRKLEELRVTRGVEREKDARGEETGRVTSVVTAINQDRYNRELAIASIVDWNLPGGDDQPPAEKWALSPEGALRAYYNNLSEEDQDLVEAACVLGNAEPTKEEDAQFPVDGERGVPVGQDEASDDREVPDRGEVLAAVGDTSGPSDP